MEDRVPGKLLSGNKDLLFFSKVRPFLIAVMKMEMCLLVLVEYTITELAFDC